MRLAVVGLGATGLYAARHLHTYHPEQLFVFDTDERRMDLAFEHPDLGDVVAGSVLGEGADLVILATPAGTHAALARPIVNAGRHVVSLTDHPGDVAALLEMSAEAEAADVTVLVGAGFAPGLSCLLARRGADVLDSVELVSVAKSGTGGPSCAREHHRAMKHPGHEFQHGDWVMRSGGSGRELVWFPDPIGARDCYRADLPSPLLLQRVFPDASRLTARVSATRRDRFTSRLPMMRPPHADGGPGAIRVEVRGRRGGAVETVVYGVADQPSLAAGLVAATSGVDLLVHRRPTGAYGLAEHPGHLDLLRDIRAHGVRVETYQGAGLL